MARDEMLELMDALRASIARLTETASDDRALTRALAHLWSAIDELEMLTDQRPVSRAS